MLSGILGQRLIKGCKASGSFLAYALGRYGEDRCRVVAGSLSYVSVLALVPLVAIIFAVLAAVPALEGFRGELTNFVFANLMPESSDKVEESLNGFIASARNMTTFGIAGLVVVSIIMINTIFAEMSIIFRVERQRPILIRLGVYLGALIAGPLVLAVSFSLATYIFALTRGLGVEEYTGSLSWITRVMPASIMVMGFVLFYKMVPNRSVAWRDAFLGGLVAGLLFSALRWLFGIYLVLFPTYKIIYGALSVVPVFLIWMFLSWTVVLGGAVMTASLQDWRSMRKQEQEKP